MAEKLETGDNIPQPELPHIRNVSRTEMARVLGGQLIYKEVEGERIADRIELDHDKRILLEGRMVGMDYGGSRWDYSPVLEMDTTFRAALSINLVDTVLSFGVGEISFVFPHSYGKKGPEVSWVTISQENGISLNSRPMRRSNIDPEILRAAQKAKEIFLGPKL